MTARAEEVVRTENLVRRSILEGVHPVAAFRKYDFQAPASNPRASLLRDIHDARALDPRGIGLSRPACYPLGTRAAPEPVFCEHAIYPMLAGHAVYIQPFIMSQLAREEKWDQAPVVRALREGRFSVLTTTEDVLGSGFTFHYTDKMRSAMRESYRLTETLGNPKEQKQGLFGHYILERKPK